jgi:hypothetical protein
MGPPFRLYTDVSIARIGVRPDEPGAAVAPRPRGSRWTRNGGWRRHPFAPRATDTVPTARASAQLKRRTLAARLDALAERHIRELEESACVDPGHVLATVAKVAIFRTDQ